MIRVGIVGTGRLGAIYAKMFLGRIDGARLQAVAGHRALELQDEYGIPEAYPDRMELFGSRDVDAIVIASTTATHPEFAIAALETGKPVFCEKPPSLTLSDALSMKTAVENSGGFFHMGFMRRFDPGYVRAHQVVETSPKVPVLFRAKSRDANRTSIEYAKTSGGLIFDMGVHDFDLAHWFMGEVVEVMAYGTCMAFPELKEVNDIDNATIMLKFESGALGVIDLSRNAGYGYDIETEVLMTSGAVRVQNLRADSCDILSPVGTIQQPVVLSFVEKFDTAFVTQLQDFIDHIRAEIPPSVTINDGVNAVRTALTATWSLKNGRPMDPIQFRDELLHV